MSPDLTFYFSISYRNSPYIQSNMYNMKYHISLQLMLLCHLTEMIASVFLLEDAYLSLGGPY
jgi:hypothetical protein